MIKPEDAELFRLIMEPMAMAPKDQQDITLLSYALKFASRLEEIIGQLAEQLPTHSLQELCVAMVYRMRGVAFPSRIRGVLEENGTEGMGRLVYLALLLHEKIDEKDAQFNAGDIGSFRSIRDLIQSEVVSYEIEFLFEPVDLNSWRRQQSIYDEIYVKLMYIAFEYYDRLESELESFRGYGLSEMEVVRGYLWGGAYMSPLFFYCDSMVTGLELARKVRENTDQDL